MEYELTEGVYKVKDHALQLANCKEWVAEQLTYLPEHITDAESRKLVKSIRADNNKQIKAIKDLRIKLNEQVLGTFNAEVKEYEKALGELEAACKALVDADKAKSEGPKPLELRIYSFDMETIEKIAKYAEKFGAKVDIL